MIRLVSGDDNTAFTLPRYAMANVER